jgi:hypothetical protein
MVEKQSKNAPKTPKNTPKLTLFRLSWPAEKTISPVTALTRRRVAVAVAVAVRGSQGPVYLKKGADIIKNRRKLARKWI